MFSKSKSLFSSERADTSTTGIVEPDILVWYQLRTAFCLGVYRSGVDFCLWVCVDFCAVGLDLVRIFVLCVQIWFKSGVDCSLVDRSAADVHWHSVSKRSHNVYFENATKQWKKILEIFLHDMPTKCWKLIVANVQTIFQKKIVSGKSSCNFQKIKNYWLVAKN